MRLSAPIRAAALIAGVFWLTADTAHAAGARAAPVACGAPYRVERGDTLQKIAERAYGPDASYVTLHKANRPMVGRNPSQLEIGVTIEIPCLDAAGAPIARESRAGDAAPEGTAAASFPDSPMEAPAAPARPLRILAATGWAPLLEETAPGGGMLADMVSAALSRVMAPGDFRIDFINDRGAHLAPLLADGAYDLSIGWIRPDCARASQLGAESRSRCRDLAWSDPLFEQVIGYYTRADAPAPAGHSALRGRRICRPAAHSLAMLEAVGLAPPNIALERPETVTACFRRLLAGEADVVVAATSAADAALTTPAAQDDVAEQPHLAALATLRAATSAKNPRGRAHLARIDAGMRRLRADGAWFEIIRRHLSGEAEGDGG